MRKFFIIILSGVILTFLNLTYLSAAQRGVTAKTLNVDGSTNEISLYSGYHALVIGCGDYRNGWPKLPNPVKDARDIAGELKTSGWTVDLLEDPDWAKLRRALNSLITGPGREENKAILIWFSGHGHTLSELGGTKLGYIVPVDAPRPDQDELGFMEKAVSMRQIETIVRRIKAKHVITLFDSCFSGAIFQAVRSAPTPYIAEKVNKPVREFITAGSEDEQVPDRSVFKVVFLQGIKDRFADRNKDGYVTGLEIGDYLQEEVTNYSRGAQHPQFGKINDPNLDKGDFVFQLAGVQTPFMPPVPDEGQDRLIREKTTTERERQAIERLKALEKELQEERNRLEVEKQKIEMAKLPTDSNLPINYRKLSILPFKISIDQAGRRSYIDREVISIVVKGLSDGLRETKIFSPTLSYYQLDERFNAEMMNEKILADQTIADLWVKKSFFSDPEPNIDLIAQIGDQQKVDAVLLSYLDVSLGKDLIHVFLVDVKQRKKYDAQATVTHIRRVGRGKMQRLTKKVFAQYLSDNQ